VLIWPVAVQGSGAAEQIALAIRGMNDLESQRKPDVLIVARGGGSLEDLWAFNEECVVRAAFHSEIPLISAIGHETDTTLIDFVADKRAPTPTAAAEMATPVLSHIWIRLQSIKNQSVKALVNLTERMTLKLIACRVLSSANLFQERMFRLEDCSEQLAFSWQRQREKRENMLQYYKTWLKRPAHFLSEKVLQDKGFRLVTLSQALIHSWQRTLEKRTDMLEWRTVKSSWIQSSLSAAKLKLETPTQRLLPIIQQKLRDAQQNLEWCSHTLAQNSYETILKKGFCMATDESKRIIKSAQNMSAGTRLSLHFSDGTIVATTE
jgi:exodeoxyribonuclease VII large subunit